MRRLLIAILMLAWAGGSEGATYYVAKTGSNTAPYDTWAKAATSPKTIMDTIKAAADSTDTVYIGAGTWTGATDFTYLDNVYHSNTTIIGSGIGNTVLHPSGGHTILGSANASNVSISNLTIYGSGTNRGVYKSAGCTGWSFDNTEFISSDNHTSILVDIKGDDTDFTRCSFRHRYTNGQYSLYLQGNASGTLSYCIFYPPDDFPYTGSLVLYGSGTTNLHNVTVLGVQTSAIMTQGTVNVNNSIIQGSVYNGTAYTIQKVGGTLNLTNNIIIANPWDGDARWITGTPDIDTANIYTNVSPNFQSVKGGYILPHIDDAANLAYATSLAPVLNTYGMKGSFFIQPSSDYVGSGSYDEIRALVSGGIIEVASHGAHHSNMLYAHALRVAYSGAGANPVASFDNVNITLSTDTVDNVVIDTTSASKNTLGEIVGNYGTGNVWSITLSTTGSQDNALIGTTVPAWAMLIKTPTAVPCDIDFDTTGYTTGFFKSEIADAKTYLQSTIVGAVTDPQTGSAYVANTFGFPFNGQTTGSRTAVIDSGYLLGRGTLNTAGAFPTYLQYSTGFDIYTIGVIAAGTYLVGSNETNTRYNARAIGLAVAYTGMVLSVSSHTAAETSLTNWGYILDEWNKIPNLTVTSHQIFANTVRTGGSWTDNSAGTYTRTYPSPDLRLRSSSPAINAGVDVGLTSDFLGNPIVGLPDIGAYEYQPPATTGCTRFPCFPTWPTWPGWGR